MIHLGRFCFLLSYCESILINGGFGVSAESGSKVSTELSKAYPPVNFAGRFEIVDVN